MGNLKSGYDFGGWATKPDLKCSDGRIIMPDAFAHNDGLTVPLVWNHDHQTPDSILGQAYLEKRDGGIYAHCKFNDTDAAKTSKQLVQHGDIVSLSIYANKINEKMSHVSHGDIKEVSLVLAGANPGAYIDERAFAHGDEGSLTEGVLYTGEELDVGSVQHSGEKDPAGDDMPVSSKDTKPDDTETVKDVFESMTEKQKNATYAMIGAIMADQKKNADNSADDTKSTEEGETMKHNVFDQDNGAEKGNVLSHSDIEGIITEAKKTGSLRDAAIAAGADQVIAHASDRNGQTVSYGVADIDYLFPEAKNVTNTPIFIKRDTSWVTVVMGGVKHSPFSRIKSLFANITAAEARAKGYVKGKKKLEEVFTLLKRSTAPCTVYKKQKLDRDDIIDITDFDVVSWIKSEMRTMLDEELARAILVGDGRSTASDDKIKEDCIRPIWTDDALFTIKANVDVTANDTSDTKAKKMIRAVIKARKDYKGSGNPILFTTEDILTDMLLLEDNTGRELYESVEKLATKLRVSKIVTSPVMEGLKRTGTSAVDGDTKDRELMAILVNLSDYTLGADKGGQVSLFDDFDIDFNQQKYLIETRCSGALTIPYSAIAVEAVLPASATQTDPEQTPTGDDSSNT